MEIRSEILLIVQLAVGLVFLWSGAAKAVHPGAFVEALRAYPIPRWSAVPVGVLMIVIELTLALAHLFGTSPSFTIAAALLTLMAFFLVVSAVLMNGSTLQCLCFGAASQERISVRSLIRLISLIAAECLLGWGYWFGGVWWRPFELSALNLLAAVVCVVPLLLLASLIISFADAWQLWKHASRRM